MNQNRSKYFPNIKPYMVWGLLSLLYFAVGVQNSVIRGIYFAIMFTSIQFVVYTCNSVFFIPAFFEKSKVRFYFFSILGLLIFTSTTAILDLYLMRCIGEAKSNSFVFPFFLHTVLCFAASWISIAQYLMEKEKRTNIEIEGLKREKIESELKFLKMQINPHFLFNAMNNIYTMAYTGDSSAPEKIAMLSDMLRYVLYECESDFISLSREMEYINSYIEFQQLKTEKEQNIVFIHYNCNEDYLIAPMLLIPFIENGFKHSKIEKRKDAFVRIEMSRTPSIFTFTVQNSCPENATSCTKMKGRGIGIDNVRSRLELLYPGAYKLETTKQNDKYLAHLELYRR